MLHRQEFVVPNELTTDSRNLPPSQRRRLALNTTVHPQTLDKLKRLSTRFACTQGRVLDKLVDAADRAWESRKLVCVTGQLCQIGRTDLPDVL
jgi:hypothetical protein